MPARECQRGWGKKHDNCMSKHFVNKIEKGLHRPETGRWDDFKEISVGN